MAKKTQVLQEEINNNNDWALMLNKSGMYVVDVYSEWCGPCVSMIGNLRKVQLELDNEYLHYAIAKSDNIDDLKRFQQRSEPHWLFFFDGKLANIIIDANAPRLINLITVEIEEYMKYKNLEIQRNFIPISYITEEEQKKLLEYKQFQNQELHNQMKIRDDGFLKIKIHTLNKFSLNVQLQTCIIFFPHMARYITMEKPPEENFEELEEPVMVEGRIWDVANTCSLHYGDINIEETKEIQLTKDTLEKIFFYDKKLLNSFPSELIDDILSKKVFTSLLSLPSDIEEANINEKNEDLISKDETIEQRMCTIIYGNCNPLNPNLESLAAEHTIINNSGEVIPALYTPTNPLSKVLALSVLFKEFCKNKGFVEPQPPPPQYVLIFEIKKTNIVLPIIEELEDKILHYGFYRSADSENPWLLCKDYESLMAYGEENINEDAKLILAVLKDDKDKSLLQFINIGPIYASPDCETGIDDAMKFFPYNYDEMDGQMEMQPDIVEEDTNQVEYRIYEDEGELNEEFSVEETQSLIIT